MYLSKTTYDTVEHLPKQEMFNCHTRDTLATPTRTKRGLNIGAAACVRPASAAFGKHRPPPLLVT